MAARFVIAGDDVLQDFQLSPKYKQKYESVGQVLEKVGSF